MLELIETGSILGVILAPLFTMKCIQVCQYIAQVSIAYSCNNVWSLLPNEVNLFLQKRLTSFAKIG